jgi:hypothetical protein
MKLKLERLEELKVELHGEAGPDYGNQEPLGLQIIMEALRGYLYNHDGENGVIVKLLKDYGILVNEIEDESPVVKPHKFNTNG